MPLLQAQAAGTHPSLVGRTCSSEADLFAGGGRLVHRIENLEDLERLLTGRERDLVGLYALDEVKDLAFITHLVEIACIGFS